MTASVSHIYQLLPQQPGTFQWAPVKVEIGGKVYQSNPLTITIEQASIKPSQPGTYAFAELSVSNPKPFVNEQTILTFKLYRRTGARNINLNWSFDPFQHKKLGKGREYTRIIN